MTKPQQWSVPAATEQPNEDALFWPDGVAVVIDGAGLPRDIRAWCRHTVGWYASQLASAFGTALMDREVTMPQALSGAITLVSHGNEGCNLDEGSPSAAVS